MPWLKAFHIDTYVGFLQLFGGKTVIFLAPCICEILFVAQIKIPRGGIICATNKILQIQAKRGCATEAVNSH
jgi:hypothetical protein